MTPERTTKLINICDQVAKDLRQDAEDFDGRPFTGKNVATYFGYQGAAISALANVLKEVIEEIQRNQ